MITDVFQADMSSERAIRREEGERLARVRHSHSHTHTAVVITFTKGP